MSSGCLPLLCVVVPGWCSRDVAALRASPCSRVRTACFGGTRSPAQHRGGLCRCWCDRLGGGRPPSGEAWAQHWTPSILWRLLTHHVFSWCSLQRGLGPHSGRVPLLCAWLHALLCSAPRHPLGCHATGAGRLCVCSGVAPVPVVCCRWGVGVIRLIRRAEPACGVGSSTRLADARRGGVAPGKGGGGGQNRPLTYSGDQKEVVGPLHLWPEAKIEIAAIIQRQNGIRELDKGSGSPFRVNSTRVVYPPTTFHTDGIACPKV